MKQTSNYQLNQWEKTDRILMEDFNGDNAKVDAALKGLDTNVNAAAVALAKCGNCQVYYTTYTGTGSGSNSFTFPRRPLFICVMGNNISFFAVQGAPSGTGRRGTGMGVSNITWTGNSVSWASENGNIIYQCNESGKTYYMVVLMDASE